MRTNWGVASIIIVKQFALLQLFAIARLLAIAWTIHHSFVLPNYITHSLNAYVVTPSEHTLRHAQTSTEQRTRTQTCSHITKRIEGQSYIACPQHSP